jgi:hypothetical protein
MPARVAESDPRDPTSELFPSERMDFPTVRLLDRFRSTGEFVVPAKKTERACLLFCIVKPRPVRGQTYLVGEGSLAAIALRPISVDSAAADFS